MLPVRRVILVCLAHCRRGRGISTTVIILRLFTGKLRDAGHGGTGAVPT